MSTARRSQIFAGLALSLGTASALTLFGPAPQAELVTRLTGEVMWWGAVAAVLLTIAFVERKPFASAGLRKPDRKELLIAVVAGTAIAAGAIFIFLALFPVLLLSISMSHVSNILRMPYWYIVIMVARIAVAEELLFRGYVIERIEELGFGRWAGAALSLAVYAAVHWSGWNPVESIATIFIGAMLSALYLWRRNTYVNMIAHFIVTGAGYLV